MSTLEFLSYLRNLDVKLSVEDGQLRCNAPRGVLTPALQAELAARKLEVIALLRQTHASSAAAVPPLVAVARNGAVPLSFGQERLWTLISRAPESAAYNLPLAFRLHGPLDLAALERSLAEIIRRHESLRTSFGLAADQPVMLIAAQPTIVLPTLDLRGAPPQERERIARDRVYQEVRTPFSLQEGPLLRVLLLRMTDSDNILVLVMQHIISDGWSFDVFLEELTLLYEAYRTSQPPELPELPLQYADYAIWQRAYLQGDTLAELIAYWQQELQGEVQPLELPTDRSRPAPQSYQGKRQVLALSETLTAQLRALAAREGTTLFMTLLAAYQAFLFRYSGQEDLVLCTPVACRDRPEVKGLIGYLNNLLVLRTDLSGNPSFRELISRVRTVALGAYQHQELPFQQLTEFPNLARIPLARGMFTLQPAPPRSLVLPGVRVSPLAVHNGTSNFDLSLSVQPAGKGLEAALDYKTSLFADATIGRMLSDFHALLTIVAADPAQRLGSLAQRTPAATNGRRSRSDIPPATPVIQQRNVPPSDALELQLAQLWEEVLGVQPVGVRDDFFALGGHSLLAARLFERIETVLGRRLPLATLFELSTVEQLASALRDEGWSPPWRSLIAMQPRGSKAPLFCIHSYEGHVLFYRDLARHLAPDHPVYGLQALGLDGERRPLTRVEKMAAHYLREIRTVQPHGPYYLVAMCFGIAVAFEMAQQLRAAGEEVGELIMLDSGFLTRLPAPEPEPRATLVRRLLRHARERAWEIKERSRRGIERFSLTGLERRDLRLRDAHERAWYSYQPRLYPGRITLIRSVDYGLKQEWHLDTWSELATGGVQTFTVPGDHLSMLQEPHVRQLAARVRACVDAALAQV